MWRHETAENHKLTVLTPFEYGWWHRLCPWNGDDWGMVYGTGFITLCRIVAHPLIMSLRKLPMLIMLMWSVFVTLDSIVHNQWLLGDVVNCSFKSPFWLALEHVLLNDNVHLCNSFLMFAISHVWPFEKPDMCQQRKGVGR